MIEAYLNHCRIVQEALTGQRAVEQQTFASLRILADRLGRLKKLGGGFSNVAFSPAVKKLTEQKNAVMAFSG